MEDSCCGSHAHSDSNTHNTGRGTRTRNNSSSNNSDNVKFHLTVVLVSACLAFFRRALQMSRSSRRFSSSRLSFCGGQVDSNQKGEFWQILQFKVSIQQEGNQHKQDNSSVSNECPWCHTSPSFGSWSTKKHTLHKKISQLDLRIWFSSLLPRSCVVEQGKLQLRYRGTPAQLPPVFSGTLPQSSECCL